jgi:glycosyltransferase involved in cell wall biosynthesis
MRWVGASYGPSSDGEGRVPRILVLTRYGRLSPTTRVRFLQFIEQFERGGDAGLGFDVAPLLEDHSLQRFYDDGTRSPAYLLKRYAKRVRLLLRCKRYELLWIEKELFPGAPALAEWLLAALGVKVVVDYDDAAYCWYRDNPIWLVRTFLSRKIDAVCRAATVVITGNETLAAYARDAGAGKVVIVPSVIDTTKYGQSRPASNTSEFVVGWIGTPSNVRYLEIFKVALADMAAGRNFKFLTIGAPARLFAGVPQEAHPWSAETEIELLGRCDCMVAPLGDGSFESGKCGFKVIQGMAAGLPVIASPIGVIKDIIRHGENGFLAENAAQCGDIMRQLRADTSMRRRIGDKARETIARSYSTSAVSDAVAHVLYEALGGQYLSRAPTAPSFTVGPGDCGGFAA